jgi:putative hydrolase of the HAD superfamily
VERSGLWCAFEDRVLIYIHKEQMLDDAERFYPAKRYVVIDDKLRILTAIKKRWGARVTTIFVEQGHYAHDATILGTYPAAGIHLAKIGDLLNYDFSAFLE